MNLCIEALNIRAGGGITYIKELLDNVDYQMFNLGKISLFSNRNTLIQIPK